MAARRICRFSASVGSVIARLGLVFNIVLYLSALSVAQTDDPSDRASVDECHVVQAIAFGDKATHSQFVVLEAIIDPDKCFVPYELLGERQRETVPGLVDSVLGWIEVDGHALV
jgi:hypothetical protein